MKILILKRDKVGDLLLATPMLVHLRSSLPGAEIHLLANDYNAWVVEGRAEIDRLWIYPRFRHGGEIRWRALWAQARQFAQLRKQRFDAAIAAGGVVSPRAVARLMRLGARRTIAYSDGSAPYRRLTDPMTASPGVHEVEANLRLLAPLGVNTPSRTLYPSYELPASWRRFGAEWIAQRNLTAGRFIVIGLNARRAKRKPTPDQVSRWSMHARREWGLDTVLLWQPGRADDRLYPGDDESIDAYLRDRPAHVHPFRDEQGVLPALGIVWHARASVFPDGGFAHLASVSPAGVLALFAETDVSPHPDNWRPYSSRGRFLEAGKTVAELADQQVLAELKILVDSYA